MQHHSKKYLASPQRLVQHSLVVPAPNQSRYLYYRYDVQIKTTKWLGTYPRLLYPQEKKVGCKAAKAVGNFFLKITGASMESILSWLGISRKECPKPPRLALFFSFPCSSATSPTRTTITKGNTLFQISTTSYNL